MLFPASETRPAAETPAATRWRGVRQDGAPFELRATLLAARLGDCDGVIALLDTATADAPQPNAPHGDEIGELHQRSEQLLEACRLAEITTFELTHPHGPTDALASLVPPAGTGAFAALDAAVNSAIGPVHADDRRLVRNAVAKCITRQMPFDIEFRVLPTNRRVRFYRLVGSCRTDSAGTVFKISGVRQDITARKEAEAKLLQAEKLKSIGELTGGIAHDFNNLLTVISVNIEMLLDIVRDEGRDDLTELIEPALHAVNSGAKLTAHLLAFAQRQPLRPKPVALDTFLSALRDLAIRTIGPNATVDLICPAGLWRCLADRVQLESALLNLIVNARDAMPAGGHIVIEARNVRLAAGADGLEPGDYVCLAVADQGVGVSPEIMDRIFEPFFTTKPVGKGTGLGLSMVLGFVRQSNGRVEVASEPGGGTRVSLYLPRSEESTADSHDGPGADPADWSPLAFQTLVVDDNPDVLRAVARMCGEIGLHAVPADSAERAIALLKSGRPFDLLLADVVLPGRLGGAELAKEALRLLPSIRVLFTSGYINADIVNRAKLGPGAELLVKPFTRGQLLDALRRTMNGSLPSASVGTIAHSDGSGPLQRRHP